MQKSLSVLQNCKKEHLSTYPFPYIFIPNALPENYYNELEASLPGRDSLVSWMQKDSNPLICSYHNTRNNLPPIWQDFFDYHTSPEFVAEVMKWGAELDLQKQLFGEIKFDEVANVAADPKNIGIRKKLKGKINTDCQLVNNAAGNTLLVGPHLDNPVEIYAGLLYMRDPKDKAEGGNLEVFSCKPKYKTYGKDRLKRKYVKMEQQIDYQRNGLLLFFNSPKSVHGVSPRRNADLPRRHVNMIGEFNKKLFDNTLLASNTAWDKMLWNVQKRRGKIL